MTPAKHTSGDAVTGECSAEKPTRGGRRGVDATCRSQRNPHGSHSSRLEQEAAMENMRGLNEKMITGASHSPLPQSPRRLKELEQVAVKWKRQYEGLKEQTERQGTHTEPAGGSNKELNYWRQPAQKHNKEAEKYNKEAQHWKAACEQEKALTECIDLLRYTTSENLKLKSKVEVLQEFKDCA